MGLLTQDTPAWTVAGWLSVVLLLLLTTLPVLMTPWPTFSLYSPRHMAPNTDPELSDSKP